MISEASPVFVGNRDIETDAFGIHRSCTNINRYEIIFLIVAILATLVTDGLTITRLIQVSTRDEDFAYSILILVISVFLIIFLATGIAFQRITDIVVFFISACMITIYVIVHFIVRWKQGNGTEDTDGKILLARLIFTIVFNVCFIPLSIIVIQDYERDEFAKRLFGVFPTARWPLRMYNIFDCIARINTMFSISLFMLNLYNFNQFESTDQILLGCGIPLTLLWLGVGVGMVRIENYILVGVFYLISLFQPGFIIYCLISGIDYSPTSTTITTSPFTPTTDSTSTFTSTFTTTTDSTSPLTTITSSTALFAIITGSTSPFTTVTSPTSLFKIITSLISLAESIISIVQALYVCIAINILTHILSMIFAVVCIRNFGKGLKEKVFNNKFDQWFQKRYSRG